MLLIHNPHTLMIRTENTCKNSLSNQNGLFPSFSWQEMVFFKSKDPVAVAHRPTCPVREFEESWSTSAEHCVVLQLLFKFRLPEKKSSLISWVWIWHPPHISTDKISRYIYICLYNTHRYIYIAGNASAFIISHQNEFLQICNHIV